MNRLHKTWFRLLLVTTMVTLALLFAGCAGQQAATAIAGPSRPAPGSATAGPAPLTAQPSTQGARATTAGAAAAAATNTGTPASGQLAPPGAAATGTPAGATAAAQTSTATIAPGGSASAATATPTGRDLASLKIGLMPVAQGLSNPLYVTHAGDGSGRIFVVEKSGAIRIIADGELLDAPFLDISGRVTSSGSEQGLLGLAFPPDYATRKFFFVDYIDKSGNTAVSRFTVTSDPNVADPGSESTVLTFDQPAPNHNGGDLVFGPDGYLWIGTGDGGAANDRFGNGQNPQTRLAKMLRIDVTSDPSKPYLIPPDNPSLSQHWQVLPEIWAVGLRNPWRYSFDRATGDLWIGDVGQNQIEEIDVVRAGSRGGLNFGWSIMEGPSCFQSANCDQNGLVLPVASYEHGVDGCSVTGGYVYRGKQWPSLAGVYLYGDYCSGRIWGLDAANPGQPKLLFEAGPGLSSFGEDEGGEVYITDLANGTVRRIVVQ